MFEEFNNQLNRMWGQANIANKYQAYFRAYPISMMAGAERENVNYGGKIIMPPSALNKLTMLHITYPMLFEIRSEDTGRVSHAGVLEFIAEEGRVYLPYWIMQTLAIAPGSLLNISSLDLPLGSFVKIEPQSVDFLDISDPKAVLENALRHFSTLTKDDIFQISYNQKIYEIKVLEIKPENDFNAICVVETDLEVDFAPPVGYVDPSSANDLTAKTTRNRGGFTPSIGPGKMAQEIGYEEMIKKDSAAKVNKSLFAGTGQKLSGKAVSKEPSKEPSEEPQTPTEGELDHDSGPLELPFGQLFFGYPIVPYVKEGTEEPQEQEAVTTFKGTGQSLRQARKRKQNNNSDNGEPPAQKHSPEVIEID